MIIFPLVFDYSLKIPFGIEFSENTREPFEIVFQSTSRLFPLSFDIGIEISDVKAYDGSYKVTPKVTEQVLETKNSYMKDDVTVIGIPYFDVSNASGGSTVYIADETEVK